MSKSGKRKHKGLVITAVILSLFVILAAAGSCGSSEDQSGRSSSSLETLERSTAAETSESAAPIEETESSSADISSSELEETEERSSKQGINQLESSSPKIESSIENVPPLLAEGGEAQYLPGCQKEAPFTMTMLDVKQGLSLLFESDGKYLLYDGGGRRSSSYVFDYVRKHTGGQLDYLVSSHYDEDHVSGLVGVLLKDKVGTVLCPDYTNDTDIYSSFASALQENGAAVIHPEAGDKYQFGNASVTVLSADYSAGEENNRSIALKVTYGSFSIIVTGDAEEGAEQKMVNSGVDLDAQVYVAGHHGSDHSSSSAFLSAVSPAFTFISCGAGNDFGHPEEGMLSRLQEAGSQMFRTDKQGAVTVYSDGANYWFSTEPCQDWSSPTVGESSSDGASDSGSTDSGSANSGSTGSGSAPSNGTDIAVSDDAGTGASQGAGASEGVVASGSQETEAGSTPTGTTPAENTPAESTPVENTHEYVLNTNTMVFHYPGCSSVNRMKDSNKVFVNDTRDNIINQGYKPCGRCCP